MHRLRVLGLVIRAGIKSRMEYRLDFILRVTTAVVWNLTSLVFIWAVLARFKSMAGWSQGEIFFVYTLRLLAHACYCLLFHNVQGLSWYVRRGDLDRVLLRPLDPLAQLITWQYDPAGIGDLGLGIICFVIANRLLGFHWSPAAIVFLLLVMAGGCLIELSLYLIVNTLAFWITEVGRLRWVVMTFSDDFALYPLDIYNTPLQFLMTFIVPVGFMSYYPATLFLNRTGDTLFAPVFAYLTPLVGLGLFAIAYAFWKAGLDQYQSTGS
ncbi:MAG: ABC-2 family transporter protein [Chloroflexota bacterium]|nr:ABC-2 family transporter protein [Chloroflexota bacterium]